MPKDLKHIFINCLEKSERIIKKLPKSTENQKKFYASDFFKHWFRNEGDSFYFIFRKNVDVTNLQFAELLSLIRSNIYSEDNEPIHNLQFSSVEDFTEALQQLVGAFSPSQIVENRYNFIANTYLSIFEKRIVVISFRGSCAVFIPPKLKLNLEAVCAYSGYIYCCGKSLFIRRISKATPDEFLEVIKNYSKGISKRRKVFFTVYAHEDFTKYDREHQNNLAHGLDDLKIHLEKFYMNKSRLVKVMEKIRDKHSDKLFIPNPGDFRRTHKLFLETKSIEKSKTLWLLADNRIDLNNSEKDFPKYYICYEQLYKNENQFQGFFDENKPAWIAPITIPHTLISAMINITLPIYSKQIDLLDPFVGTGTSWLEGNKYSSIKVHGSDSSNATHLLVEDNLDFFRLSPEKLKSHELCATEICEYIDKRIKIYPINTEENTNNHTSDDDTSNHISDNNIDRIRWVRETFFSCFSEQGNKDIQSFDLSESHIAQLKDKSLIDRILFYLALRAFLKNIGAYHRNTLPTTPQSENFWNENVKFRYAKELENFVYQVRHLSYLKQREKVAIKRSEDYSIFQGRFSLSTSINFDRLKSLDPKETIKECKAEDIKNEYDVIVTDPPYGFNTDEDIEGLAKLYTEFTISILNSLKDNGQLVICLPEKSHTGRHSPFFTHKEIFIKQFLSVAENLDREIVLPAHIVPTPKNLYNAPYYWESERALRRTILHFRVRKFVRDDA